MNLSLQNAIDLLHTTDAVFALVNGAQTFHCNKRGVAPLLDLFDTQPQLLEGAYVSDKVVGRAAALLMVLGKVQMVYATVISQAAVDCFDHFGVQYCYEQLVPFIQNRNKTGGCPMEQACWNVCDPKEAYTVLKQTLAQMQGKSLVNNLTKVLLSYVTKSAF